MEWWKKLSSCSLNVFGVRVQVKFGLDALFFSVCVPLLSTVVSGALWARVVGKKCKNLGESEIQSPVGFNNINFFPVVNYIIVICDRNK